MRPILSELTTVIQVRDGRSRSQLSIHRFAADRQDDQHGKQYQRTEELRRAGFIDQSQPAAAEDKWQNAGRRSDGQQSDKDRAALAARRCAGQ